MFSNQIRFSSRRFGANKVFNSPYEAVKDIPNGANLLLGGFGCCGVPMSLVWALKRTNPRDLTIVSSTAGLDDYGFGVLLQNDQVKKLVSSYVGECPALQRKYHNGELELELLPMGTFAEKIKSGGAGIPGFYTPTGVNTMVAQGGFPMKLDGQGNPVIVSDGKHVREFKGRSYVFEQSIKGDYALVRAWKADRAGNLVYRKAMRNTNADMATAGKIVIAEVDEIVENGEIDPNEVHTPSPFVNRIVKTEETARRIEKLVYEEDIELDSKDPEKQKRYKIAKRASKEILPGMNVNLGIGIPTLVPFFVPKDIRHNIHSENGVLGVAGYPRKGEEDPDLINAGKETIKIKPGASFFSSSTSFGMVRGNHLDLSIMGGIEVSKDGDLANWYVPGKLVKGMGAAMDLVSAQMKVVIAMKHTYKGKPKLLERCTLPSTSKKCVSRIITELGVFDIEEGEMVLKEIAEETNLEAVRSATEANFKVAANLRKF